MRRMCSHGRSRPRRDGGFVLLDAVVALGVAAMLASGVYGLLRSATAGVGRLEAELSREAAVREEVVSDEAELFRRR